MIGGGVSTAQVCPGAGRNPGSGGSAVVSRQPRNGRQAAAPPRSLHNQGMPEERSAGKPVFSAVLQTPLRCKTSKLVQAAAKLMHARVESSRQAPAPRSMQFVSHRPRPEPLSPSAAPHFSGRFVRLAPHLPHALALQGERNSSGSRFQTHPAFGSPERVANVNQRNQILMEDLSWLERDTELLQWAQTAGHSGEGPLEPPLPGWSNDAVPLHYRSRLNAYPWRTVATGIPEWTAERLAHEMQRRLAETREHPRRNDCPAKTGADASK